MISLSRGEPPAQLDGATAEKLREEYVREGTAVWNHPYIREALLIQSASKCSYCETSITEESKYMEVEHFRCKRDFPELVVHWENLLPACKRCNVNKGSYNVEQEGMIVDPFSVSPSQHLYLKNFRLRARDELGRQTIDVLYLNDSDRLVKTRMQIGDAIAQALDDLRNRLADYLGGEQSNLRKNRITRGMLALLAQCQPSAEYSALTATILLDDPDYHWIRSRLVELGEWGPMTELEGEANNLRLDF